MTGASVKGTERAQGPECAQGPELSPPSGPEDKKECSKSPPP